MGRRPQPLGEELLALGRKMQAVAAEQGGVIAAVQCRVLGATASDIRRLLAHGSWRRVRRGTYQEARGPTNHRTRCAALLAGVGRGGAVVSHLSAARLLGLPLAPGAPDDVMITRPPPAPANRLGPGSRVHVARFDGNDVVDVGGVPVLGGARLVLDCCTATDPGSVLAIADAALRRRITTPDALREALDRHRGRRGIRLAALVVERADPLAASWFESMSRWWLLEAGLPRPELQVRFRNAHGEVGAKVDMWFQSHRTVGEADGAGKYDEPGALFAEKQREDWLRDVHRVEVVRWVPREMRSSAGRAEVVARFRRAFARSARSPPYAVERQSATGRSELLRRR